MRFVFKAYTQDGRVTRGQIDALTKDAAFDSLLARGLEPIHVAAKTLEERQSLTYAQAGQIARELSRLSRAGIALEAAVKLSAEAQSSLGARRILESAASRLAAGEGPGQAFSGLVGAPARALSAVMQAGEHSGRLADALAAAAPLFIATAKFRAKILSLMIYPIIVASAALVVLMVFLLVVIPALRPVLSELGDQLPVSAQILLWSADVAPVAASLGLGSVLLIILANQFEAIKARFRTMRDHLALGPLGMGLPLAIETAVFARLLAALLKADMPAGDAIEDASRAVSNSVLQQRLQTGAQSVREGANLASALEGALGSSNLVVQAARLGAKSSGFADLVGEAGLTLAERAEERLERVAAIAGPVIILGLGLVIGSLVVALFTSLTALSDAALV